MIFQLIYTCALSASVTGEHLAEIAKSSAIRNAERDVTGILVCKDGSILQVLEGERAVVEDLYSKIETDHRVCNMIVLIRRHAERREFPDWSMGFRNGAKADGAFDLCARSFPDALPENPSQEINTISRTFARVNGLA